MNPFDIAWSILKNDSNEIKEMLANEQAKRQALRNEDSPHFDHIRRLIAEKKAETEALEANKPKPPQMTPEIQARYQDPLDAKNKKIELAQAIRRAHKAGNTRLFRELSQEYYGKHGHFPKGAGKRRGQRAMIEVRNKLPPLPQQEPQQEEPKMAEFNLKPQQEEPKMAEFDIDKL